MPWFDDYKPLGNFQGALLEEIEQRRQLATPQIPVGVDHRIDGSGDSLSGKVPWLHLLSGTQSIAAYLVEPLKQVPAFAKAQCMASTRSCYDEYRWIRSPVPLAAR